MARAMTSRRGFLLGILATAAACSLPGGPLSALPRIVGDGLHDDTKGLQALINGDPVAILKKGLFRCGNFIDFGDGRYCISRGLNFFGNGWEIRNLSVIFADGFPAHESALQFHDASTVTFRGRYQ